MQPPNTIIEGDVLAGLEEIEDRSVDLIITSPPYADARKQQYGGHPPDQYVEWYRPVARALLPKLKKSGSYILNIKEGLVDGERSTYVYDLVKAHRAEGWRWHDEFVWHKPNTIPGRSPGRLRDAWERLYWFARVRQPWLDKKANCAPIAPATASKRAYFRRKRDAGERLRCMETAYASSVAAADRLAYDSAQEAAPRNVVQIGVLAGGGHALNHPAAYPEALPAWFIRLLCPPGGLVLDPFLGSGTTAVAAEKEGRSWLGIERSPEYCRMAAGRIEAARLRRRGKK